MPNEIAAAVITGVCGIIAGAAQSVIKGVRDNRMRYDSKRARAIAGTWFGSGYDTYVELNKAPLEFELTMVFRVSGKKVRGKSELSIKGAHEGKIALDCEGGFLTDDYMQLVYRSQDWSRKQMGVIVFRLNGTGDVLTGHYAGLSPMREVFVSGAVTLKRSAPSV